MPGGATFPHRFFERNVITMMKLRLLYEYRDYVEPNTPKPQYSEFETAYLTGKGCSEFWREVQELLQEEIDIAREQGKSTAAEVEKKPCFPWNTIIQRTAGTIGVSCEQVKFEIEQWISCMGKPSKYSCVRDLVDKSEWHELVQKTDDDLEILKQLYRPCPAQGDVSQFAIGLLRKECFQNVFS